ncbi:MAG: ComEA family DNA-binding protein [Candidatus Hydrogenedentes bacterium]|nr:ComEA family DNA-binding protein [Candidatus Hydrogenedentota bacterium]
MLSRLLTRKEQVVLLALAGAISVGSLALYFHRDEKVLSSVAATSQASETKSKPAERVVKPVTPEAPPPPPANVPPTPPQATVSVVGAVKAPGVYTLEAAARIQDLLDKAGGITDDANVIDINLAARLIDGTTLSVPAKPVWDPKTRQYVQMDPQVSPYNPPQYTRSGWASGQVSAGTPGGGADATAPDKVGRGELINLNTATQQQLESLPGIGPKLAQQIIAYRTKTPFHSVDEVDKVPGFGTRRVEQIRPLVTVR